MASVEFNVLRRSSMDKLLHMSRDLRIMLFSSRSSLQFIISDCILGQQVECSFSQKNHKEIEGRKVSVINTGNIFEKDPPHQHISKELEGCVCLSCPGPHAVLLILDLKNISATDVGIVEELAKYFGDNILKYTILILCHEDKEENPNMHDRLKKDRNLREIMYKCGHRHHLFNKTSMEAKPLLQTIESLVTKNGDGFFTNDKYEEIEGMIGIVESDITKQKEKQIRKRLHELDSIYQAGELEEKRDQYLKRVRAEIRREAEQIVQHRRRKPAQDPGMHLAWGAALGGGTAVMTRALGAGVPGLMLVGAAAVVAMVVWRFLQR